MSNKLFICTHGQFAKEIIRSAEMIIGPMEDAIAICLQPGMSGEEMMEEIALQAKHYQEDDVLVIADLFGGTPCNSSARLLREYPLQIITGLNLGMLLEVYNSLQQCEVKELKKIAKEALLLSCVDVNEKMGI